MANNIRHHYTRPRYESTQKSRSDSYQYLIVESNCAQDYLEAYSNEEGLYSNYYNERKLLLQDGYIREIKKLINKLTPNQQTIYDMHVNQNMTQLEIAKILGKNQSSVVKCLVGNADKSGKIYGGLFHKLLKLAQNNIRIKEIIRLSQNEELPLPNWLLPNYHKGNSQLIDIEVMDIKKRYAKGISAKELAEEYGVSISHIRNIVCGQCWTKSHNNGGNIKLTLSDVMTIRDRYDNGEKICSIVKDYKVGRTQIHRIVNRISWSNV